MTNLVYAVSLNWNGKYETLQCLKSLSYCNYSNLKIVVVDNNSKDGSANSIKSEFPEISLIENNHNAGFAKAVNQGVKISQGEYLLVLNPDTLFVEDSLFKILNKAHKTEKLGAIGPTLISKDENIQQSFWKDPSTGILLLRAAEYFLFSFLHISSNPNIHSSHQQASEPFF